MNNTHVILRGLAHKYPWERASDRIQCKCYDRRRLKQNEINFRRPSVYLLRAGLRKR